MRTRSIRPEQRGDTIVEVLISIAIISLILATAYAISNRSTGANQDTQEHGQAQQLVQGQIEDLRAMAQSDELTAWPMSETRCVTDTAGSLQLKDNNSHECELLPDGTACDSATAPFCYVLSITNSSGIYTVTAQWKNIHGGDSTVAMEYGIANY